MINLLRFPDDEDKKNSLFTPLNAPQLPAQWFELNYLSNVNGDKIGQALGIRWMRGCRLTPLHHMSFFSFLKVMIFMMFNNAKINEKMKLFGEQANIYGKITRIEKENV